MPRRRGRHAQAPQVPPGRARRVGRVARIALPLVVAAAVIAIVITNVLGTVGQFVGGITNTQNHVESATTTVPPPALNENGECDAPADGVFHECPGDLVNKFGGGQLTSNDRRSVSVTLQNTGGTSGRLFLLPSNCSDTLTGARGVLCDQVLIEVTCSDSKFVGGPPVTLNQFHDGRNYPTGYPVPGTLAPGASTTCVFTLTTGVISTPGTVSQPIAIKLVAV
jgi:hypothetical protein